MISIKVEGVSDMQEEAVPVPISWQGMENELEVSCVSNKCAELPAVFLISLCLSGFLSVLNLLAGNSALVTLLMWKHQLQ
jgi:hypothetical protein